MAQYWNYTNPGTGFDGQAYDQQYGLALMQKLMTDAVGYKDGLQTFGEPRRDGALSSAATKLWLELEDSVATQVETAMSATNLALITRQSTAPSGLVATSAKPSPCVQNVKFLFLIWSSSIRNTEVGNTKYPELDQLQNKCYAQSVSQIASLSGFDAGQKHLATTTLPSTGFRALPRTSFTKVLRHPFASHQVIEMAFDGGASTHFPENSYAEGTALDQAAKDLHGMVIPPDTYVVNIIDDVTNTIVYNLPGHTNGNGQPANTGTVEIDALPGGSSTRNYIDHGLGTLMTAINAIPAIAAHPANRKEMWWTSPIARKFGSTSQTKALNDMFVSIIDYMVNTGVTGINRVFDERTTLPHFNPANATNAGGTAYDVVENMANYQEGQTTGVSEGVHIVLGANNNQGLRSLGGQLGKRMVAYMKEIGNYA